MSVVFTNIIELCTGLKMGYQVFELLIFRVFLKGGNRDAVVELLAEGVHGVVHEQDVLQFDVIEDPQILDVLTTLSFHTACSVEAVLDQVAVWVQMVDYRVCILGCACCKYTYLVVPVSSNKQLFCHRSNVETDIANDVAIRRRDIDLDHRGTEWVRLLYTMDKCLIKVE